MLSFWFGTFFQATTFQKGSLGIKLLAPAALTPSLMRYRAGVRDLAGEKTHVRFLTVSLHTSLGPGVTSKYHRYLLAGSSLSAEERQGPSVW